LYKKILDSIEKPDYSIIDNAKERLDSLVKPIGSLGELENISMKIAGITGNLYNKLDKKCIIIMAADNGVCEEGISISPKEVTALHTINFAKGYAAINILSKHAGNDLRIIDIGISSDVEHPSILNKKIKYGTENIATGPAMSINEAIKAIEIGIDTVKTLHEEGYNIIGTGEMGIGNTTTSSAVLIGLTGASMDLCVGRGVGIDDNGLQHKKNIIQQSLKINKPDINDPLDVLAKVGGLDIAGLVGCYIGAAYYKIPIVIDGFISVVAALIAYKLNNLTKEYIIPSHLSEEPGYNIAINEMGLKPYLNLAMRLGEGTGCPLAFNIIDAALSLTKNMATFAETMISDDFQKNN